MARILALPGSELRTRSEEGDRALVVIRDPASWLQVQRARGPGNDAERLDTWRAGVEEMLARDPRATRIVLHHRAGPATVPWPRSSEPLPLELLAPLAEVWQAALTQIGRAHV